MTGLPQPNEYAAYYSDYVSRASMEQDIIAALEKQLSVTTETLRRVPEEISAEHRDGKWSVREVIGHLCDSERVFAYRAACIARNDKTPMPGFEQDDYVREANFNEQPLDALLQLYAAVRRATVESFRNISENIAGRIGTANGQPVSARALLYITLGHERRHVELIQQRFGV
jgi:uncharacterized damage-inducible protein DinB